MKHPVTYFPELELGSLKGLANFAGFGLIKEIRTPRESPPRKKGVTPHLKATWSGNLNFSPCGEAGIRFGSSHSPDFGAVW